LGIAASPNRPKYLTINPIAFPFHGRNIASELHANAAGMQF
jgi:hypothetical protein